MAVPERTVDFVAMKGELTRRMGDGDPALKAVRSVLVSVDGETVMSYYQARKPTEQAHVWSVTKSVMSILVGVAIDEGRLRLDQTLSELLTTHQAQMSPQVASITLRQLLTMTAGLPDSGMSLDSADPVGDILSYGLVSEPGAQFGYTDTGAHLVAAVLAEAIDRPILDYAREKLFDPLELTPGRRGRAGHRIGRKRIRQARVCLGDRPIRYQPRRLRPETDRTRHDQARRVVRQRWQLERPPDRVPGLGTRVDRAQVTKDQQPDRPYGFFWWLGETNQHPLFEATGAFGQTILCFPDLDLVVVVTSAVDGEGSRDLDDTYFPVVEQVIVNPLTS